MLESQIRLIAENCPITDIHTHLWAPEQKPDQLWGIDGMLNYHYLMTETLRYIDMPYDTFFKLDSKVRAELTWKTLFVDRPPVSEACQGVLTVLKALGIDPREKNLEKIRDYYRKTNLKEHFDRVLTDTRLRAIVSTNSPLDPLEIEYWKDHDQLPDERFKTTIRLDEIVNLYDRNFPKIAAQGYDVSLTLTEKTISELQRFLKNWAFRIHPVYFACSLSPEFNYLGTEKGERIFQECVLPVAGELDIPVALMIGVHKKVNASLLEGGDSVGKCDIHKLENLLDKYPHLKFMVTVLSKDNIHDLNVAARKFRNLLPFGCWWFLNNPSIVEDATRLRIEQLGCSFIMQHSDGTFVDQLIYKWSHTKETLIKVLTELDQDMQKKGYEMTEEEMDYLVHEILGGAFWSFIARSF